MDLACLSWLDGKDVSATLDKDKRVSGGSRAQKCGELERSSAWKWRSKGH